MTEKDIYIKIMASELLTRASKRSYTVLKKIKDNVFKLRDNSANHACVMKIIIDTQHPLYKLGVKTPSKRSVKFHLLLANHDLAPKVIDHFNIKGGSVIVMKYIPFTLDEKDLKDPMVIKAMDDMIKKLHGLNIVHGDLHSRNIRYNKGFTLDLKTGDTIDYIIPYVIDADVSFLMQEYHDCEFPKKWLEHGFDISDIDEFLEAERINYKCIVDDDD
jgi:hypothetical protein